MPFDWKNGWIPIVCTGLLCFVLGVVWAHTPYATWCGAGPEDRVECAREWLMVVSGIAGGILTFIAALVVVRPAITQLKIQTIEPLVRLRNELTDTINALNSTDELIRRAQSEGDELISSWRSRPELPRDLWPRKVGNVLNSKDQDRVRSILRCTREINEAIEKVLSANYVDDTIFKRASKCTAAAQHIEALMEDMGSTNPYLNADPEVWISNTTNRLERQLKQLDQSLSDFLAERLKRRDAVLRRLLSAHDLAQRI